MNLSFSSGWIRIVFTLLISMSLCSLWAQPITPGRWRFELKRSGGIPVYVQAELKQQRGVWAITLLNDQERITLQDLRWVGDSLYARFPVFEASWAFKRWNASLWTGKLIKGIGSSAQIWEVTANPSEQRVPIAVGKPSVKLSGKWAIRFQRSDSSWRPAIGQFKQQGSKLTGTMLTPAGDYRFLEGRVWKDSFYLSAVDGAHVYAFRGRVVGDTALEGARFFAGQAPGERMEGRWDPQTALPEQAPVTELKPGESTLSFQFPDLDSQLVRFPSERYQGKVVVLQLMGSWCPNCMDETEFLSRFYNEQAAEKTVDVIALAYEVSTDFQRSAASIKRFQQRFDVQYPMLVTGVRVGDPEKAAKTLPSLTDIRYFPTTIFIGKDGRIRRIHAGFYGPGAAQEHADYKKDFYNTIRTLMAE